MAHPVAPGCSRRDRLHRRRLRVFGILLGLAALGGAVLTLGLVSRWGEVFPAWLPGFRGRPVPVLAAVVPATLVAVVLCASSISRS